MKNHLPKLLSLDSVCGISTKVLLLLFSMISFQSWSQAPIYTDNVIFEDHVSNSVRSIDVNPFTSSELNANSGAALGIGSYQGTIELEFPSLVPANQTCYVRIDCDDNILEALMGGAIGNVLSGVTGVLLTGNQEFIVQAKNGASVVLQGNSTNPNDFAGEF